MKSKRLRSPAALAFYAAFIGLGASAAYVATPTEARADDPSGIASVAKELVEAIGPERKIAPSRSLAPVVKKVQPAVVTVFTQGAEPSGMVPFLGPGSPFGEESRGLGSGFLITSDGVVVTNHHVVAHGRKLTVRLDDGRRFEAKVLGTDPQTDLAVIKLEGAKNLPTVKLGSSKSLEVGDWVLAVGSPQGMLQTASVGIISAKGRGSLNLYGNGSYVDFIQTDAMISRGSSGGPLFNLQGEVVGINTAVHGMAGGLGFAVPADQAQFVIPQLRDDGKVSRAWLGVTGKPAIEPAVGAPVVPGAVLERVHPNTPGAKAGLKDGDRVLSIDGQTVENFADLRGRVGFTRPGRKVELKVDRDGKLQTIKVKLGRLPGDEKLAQLGKMQRHGVQSGPGNGGPTPDAAPPRAPNNGAGGLFDAQGPRLGIGVERGDGGLVVRDVDGDGLGKQLGLRAGDVLLEVNGQSVDSPDEVRAALEKDDRRVTIKSERAGATHVSSIQRW
jgi:serine protease Do